MTTAALAPPGVAGRRARRTGLLVAALLVLGAAGVVAGYVGASGSVDVEEQGPWAVLAVAGTGLVCATAAVWLAAARLAVVRRRRAVTTLLATRLTPTGPVAVGSPTGALVATSAMTHYHRQSCPLAAGKPAQAAARAAHERDGRTPCGVCRP